MLKAFGTGARTALVAASIATLTASGPALAHHGVNGQFDLTQTLVKEGAVTRVRFVNPHSYVYFDVTEDDGSTVNWRCELRSGSLLKRKGWQTAMFEEGTNIRIFGSPARDEPTTCYVETITFDDGSVLFRYGEVSEDGTPINSESAKEAADNIEEAALSRDLPDFSGDWGEPIADGPPRPYAGPGPEFERTQAAIDVENDWAPEDNPRFKCQATNIILDYRFDQMANRFVQNDDTLEIKYGFMDMDRIIHLDGSFPDDIEPSRTGYSIGQWDDDRLVVTTKGFDEGFLDHAGGRSTTSLPSSTEMEIEEVFYIDGNDELVREYTITDPVYLAAPYKHLDKAVRLDNQYLPFECDDLTEEAGR